MRVIGGKYRGTVLGEFKGRDIRPTADRTKEAMFNILRPVIFGSECLDLFCGSGSLGIEALSQGAASVTFTDSAKESVELTKRNLQKIGVRADVIYTDALAFLERTGKKFDLIFIDPPYADDVSERALEIIEKRELLTENGIIIFERDIPARSCKGLSVYDVRRYGKAYISLIRSTRACLFAGTFDPITVGHQEVVKQILKRYDVVHLIIMNNADKKPLFDLRERIDMLEVLYGENKSVVIGSWDGMLVDYMKSNRLLYNVRGLRGETDLEYEKRMEIVNKAAYPEMIYDYVYTDLPVSSSAVRAGLEEGRDISYLVDKKILKSLKDKAKDQT